MCALGVTYHKFLTSRYVIKLDGCDRQSRTLPAMAADSFLDAVMKRSLDARASDATNHTDLLSMKDDVQHLILASLDASSIMAVATSCKQLAEVCRHEQLWQMLVLRVWPLLPARVRPSATESWLELARERMAIGSSMCLRMDEIERLLTKPEFSSSDGDRLAALAISVFAGHSLALADEFVRALRTALRAPVLLDALGRWAAERHDSLDEFYEGCALGSCTAALARRSVLLHAMRTASALRFLQDEIVDEDLMPLWSAARLPDASEAIASALTSLELEGFNVATPPALIPAHMPPSHRWWLARMPMHAAGRIHYC